MEIQFILAPILLMKCVLHKFYDITRTDFHPVRIEFMKLLEIEMMNINKSGWKGWNESQPIYHLSALGNKFIPFVKDIIQKGQ